MKVVRDRSASRKHAVAFALALLIGFGSAGRAEENHPAPSPSTQVANLIVQLHDKDPNHRYRTAAALMAIQPLPPEAFTAMLRAAGYPDTDIVRAVAAASPPPIPKLKASMRDPDAQVRVGTVYVLGDLAKRDSSVWPLLLEALRDGDLRVRSFSANQFSNRSAADAAMLVPKLRALMKENNSDTRMAALQATQNLGANAKDATPEIAQLLKDDRPDIRWQAADALRAIGPAAKPAEGALEAALNDSDRGLRQCAAFALASIDPHNRAAVPVLIDALGPDSVDQGVAAASLAAMGIEARDTLPVLAHLLSFSGKSTADEGVRIRIADTIEKVGGRDAVPALSDALIHDPSDEVRTAALKSIRDLGADGSAAIPALIEAMRDHDMMIRDGAKDALANLGSASRPALIEALKNNDLYIRDGAVEVLPKINPLPSEAIKALENAAAHDKSNTVREDAEIALDELHIKPSEPTAAEVTNAPVAPQATATPSDEDRTYSKEEIVATIPADDDHEYPMTLTNLLPIDDGHFLVTFHQGEDRGDRVAIWKKIGEDQYRRVQLIEASVEVDQTISPPTLFTPKGQPGNQKTQFLYIVSVTRCCTDETIFAIDRDAHELRPVVIESAEKPYQSMLRAGEQFRSTNNTFDDGKVPAFEVIIAKKTDAACCPSAGEIDGTYRIVKESTPRAAVWKFVPAGGSRQSLKQ